jgi:hypothetical protein
MGRAKQMFPIPAKAKYVVGPNVYQSEVCEIGSQRVILQLTGNVRLREPISIYIDWPVMLDGKTPLQLVILGYVVSCTATRFEVAIGHKEYRTVNVGAPLEKPDGIERSKSTSTGA